MANAEIGAEEAESPRRSRKGLLIGLVLALLLGGGGFYGVVSGLIPLGASDEAAAEGHDAPAEDHAVPGGAQGPEVGFVPIDPLLISLPPGGRVQHLRFHAQLEVDSGHEGEVAALMPRIVDVLNAFLRAVEPRTLEDPGVLPRLRSQMLRRIQIATGSDHLRDLLVMEFVLN